MTATLPARAGKVTDFIRGRDYRAVKARNRQYAAPPPASPLPNVPDMPGWSTDLKSAEAFARHNGKRVFVLLSPGREGPGTSAAPERAALSAPAVVGAMGENCRIALSLERAPAPLARAASRVDGPALVVLSPDGSLGPARPAPVSAKAAIEAIR